MKARHLAIALVVALAFALPGHAGKGEPGRVSVQHILIGFKDSIPGRKLPRSKKEARALADELLKRAQEGEDFLKLVEEYTDDKPPGIYLLTNDDAPRVAGSRQRKEMVPGFGDVAFSLKVDEIGMADYSFRLSPYGWHIIKRLE